MTVWLGCVTKHNEIKSLCDRKKKLAPYRTGIKCVIAQHPFIKFMMVFVQGSRPKSLPSYEYKAILVNWPKLAPVHLQIILLERQADDWGRLDEQLFRSG